MDPWKECLRLEASSDELVKNGVSYERAIVDFSQYRAVVIPHDCIVRRAGPIEGFNIYLEKVVAYRGWNDKPIGIEKDRHTMGVAFRLSGRAVAFATYGEWQATDGGALIRLSILVPAEMEIQKREDLSGPGGMANANTPGQIGPGPGYPKTGWSGIGTEPNPGIIRI